MSVRGFLKPLIFAFGLVLAMSSQAGDPPDGGPGLAIKYSDADYASLAVLVQSKLNSDTGLKVGINRTVQEQVPEIQQVIKPDLLPPSLLKQGLRSLQLPDGSSPTFVVRIPAHTLQLDYKMQTPEITHAPGSSRLDVTVPFEKIEVSLDKVEIGILSDPNDPKSFKPIRTDEKGSTFEAAKAKLTLQQPALHLVAELPEKGTGVTISEAKAIYSDSQVGLELQIPTIAGTFTTGSTPGQQGTIRIKVKEPAMQKIEVAAANSVRDALLTKVATPERINELEGKLVTAANSGISSARKSFNVEIGLRLPMDGESMRSVARFDSLIEGRAKRRAENSLPPGDYQRAEARALWSALKQNLSQVPPTADELRKPGTEGGPSRSTRLMVLDSFVRNMTADWNHFVQAARLTEAEQKIAKRALRRIQQQFDGTDREDELEKMEGRDPEKWGWISAEFDEIAPFLQRMIESPAGLQGTEIQEVNSGLLATLIGAKAQKAAQISIDEANTDLRNNLIALQLGLNRINNPSDFLPIAGCQISTSPSQQGSGDGPTLLGTLDVFNATAKQVLEDETLRGVFESTNLRFREPPVMEGIPGTGRFLVKAKIHETKHNIKADVVLSGEIVPSKTTPGAMEIRFNKLEDFDQKIGFWDIVNPIALIGRSLPALFGIPGNIAEKQFDKSKDKMKLTIPLQSLEQLGMEPGGFKFKSTTDFEFSLKRKAIR